MSFDSDDGGFGRSQLEVFAAIQVWIASELCHAVSDLGVDANVVVNGADATENDHANRRQLVHFRYVGRFLEKMK